MTRASLIILTAALVLGLAALALGLTWPTVRPAVREHDLANPPGAHVTALAVHPDDPELAAGGHHRRPVSHRRPRSDLAARGPALPHVSTPAEQLLFDTGDPETAYALGAFGLGISRDGGTNWDVAAPPPGAEAYLGTGQSPVDGALYILAHNGLLRSDDRGVSWTALPLPSDAPRLLSLAPHPLLSNVLVAGTERGVLQSADRGGTWTSAMGTPQGEVPWLALVADPDGRLRVYMSTGTYLSADGGTTWEISVDAPPGLDDRMLLGLSPLDVANIAVWLTHTPEPGTLPGIGADAGFAATAAGPSRTTGLIATDNALYESTDSGRTWARWDTALPAAPIEQLVGSPADPARLYASTPYGLCVTTDGARTWQPLPANMPQGVAHIVALAVDPADALSLYALDQRGSVLHSSDGGQRWSTHSVIPEASLVSPLSLAMYRMGAGKATLCLLADRLYCALGATDADRWQTVGPADATARPLALASSSDELLTLVSDDGSIHKVKAGNPPTWTRVCSGGGLSGELLAAQADSKSATWYAITDSGMMYSCTGALWTRLGEAESASIGNVDQAVLLGTQESGRPIALAHTERGVVFWNGHSQVELLEDAYPVNGPYAQLVAAASGAGAYAISGSGGLAQISTTLAPQAVLVPWLSALSACGILSALYLSWRRHPRIGRQRQYSATTRSSPSAVEHTGVGKPNVASSMDNAPGAGTAATPGAVSVDLDQRATAHPHEAPSDLAPIRATDSFASYGAELARALCERLGFEIQSEKQRGALIGYMVDASRLRFSLPQSMPLVVSSASAIGPEQADDILSLSADMGAIGSFALVLLLGETGTARDATDAPPSDDRMPNQGLVALRATEVSRIMHADKPLIELANLIQRAVPLSQISPFVQSGPVPQTMFYGREYEIKALLRTLYDRSFAVVGARKIGKTSFLGLVHKQLQSSADMLPVYVDCHHVTDEQGFLRALSLMGGVPVESASVDVLRRVVMRLRSRDRTRDRQIVLELDEIDNLLRYDLANQCRILRDLSLPVR